MIAPSATPATESNPVGGVHGGVYAVVHDAAMNFATNSALERGESGATISITYATMRGAKAGDQLRVRGEVVRLARQIAYLETTITNAEDHVVSKASGTFILRRRDPSPAGSGPARADAPSERGSPTTQP